MKKRYQLNFQFFDSWSEAQAFCDYKNKTATPYCRRRYPAHYTPWTSSNGKQKYVALYHE